MNEKYNGNKLLELVLEEIERCKQFMDIHGRKIENLAVGRYNRQLYTDISIYNEYEFLKNKLYIILEKAKVQNIIKGDNNE